MKRAVRDGRLSIAYTATVSLILFLPYLRRQSPGDNAATSLCMLRGRDAVVGDIVITKLAPTHCTVHTHSTSWRSWSFASASALAKLGRVDWVDKGEGGRQVGLIELSPLLLSVREYIARSSLSAESPVSRAAVVREGERRDCVLDCKSRQTFFSLYIRSKPFARQLVSAFCQKLRAFAVTFATGCDTFPQSLFSVARSVSRFLYRRDATRADAAERVRFGSLFFSKTHARAHTNSSRCDYRGTRRGTKRTKTQRRSGPHVHAGSAVSAAARLRSVGSGDAYRCGPTYLRALTVPIAPTRKRR